MWLIESRFKFVNVKGKVKVRVRKMRPKELEVFQKSGKLPERF